MQTELKKRALELLGDGTVDRVIGWQTGEFSYDMTPAVFTNAEDIEKNFPKVKHIMIHVNPAD